MDDELDDELKPCPFCGEINITEVMIGYDYHAMTCCTGHATGMVMDNSAKYDDIVRAWNTRIASEED
jgi:Lar family restriction alleviation protein